MTFATMVGHEPALFEPWHDVIFTDPLDDSYIPQLEDVIPAVKKKRRFPSLAELRAKSTSRVPRRAVCEETAIVDHNGCYDKTWFGPLGQKDGVVRGPIDSAPRQVVPLVATQATHLAGAAVLGLRKHAHGGVEVSAQQTCPVPKNMMQTVFSDTVPSVKVPKADKAAMAPRPPSAAARPRATGNGKRPITSNMRVLIVPVTG